MAGGVSHRTRERRGEALAIESLLLCQRGSPLVLHAYAGSYPIEGTNHRALQAHSAPGTPSATHTVTAAVHSIRPLSLSLPCLSGPVRSKTSTHLVRKQEDDRREREREGDGVIAKLGSERRRRRWSRRRPLLRACMQRVSDKTGRYQTRCASSSERVAVSCCLLAPPAS